MSPSPPCGEGISLIRHLTVTPSPKGRHFPHPSPVAAITELLRAKADADYAPIISEILGARDRLAEVVG